MSSAKPASQPSRATALSNLIGGPLDGRLAALLALIAAALILWPLNGAQHDYDEGVYWQSLRAMASGHALFSSVFSSQPPFFLVSIYPFYVLFGQSIVAARFGIACFALVAVIAMYWLGRELGGPWVGLIAAGLMAVDPLFLREARTLQAEAPALAFEILCVALAAAAMRRTGRARSALAFAAGVALALGTLTKLLDVVALVPIALYLATPIAQTWRVELAGRPRQPDSAALRPASRKALVVASWLVVGGAITCIVALAPFLGSAGAMWDQAVRFHLAAARVESTSALHNLHIISGGMKLLGGPALLALALAVWRRAWSMIPPLLWLLTSVVFLVRQAPLLDHHIVLVIPCMALMAALGVRLALTGLSAQTRRRLALAVSAVLVVCFVIGGALGVQSARDFAVGPGTSAEQAVAAIDAFTTPGQPVVTDDQYVAALADRSTPPQLVDTSSVRIASGYLTAAQLEAVLSQPQNRIVLLGTGRLQNVPGFMAWFSANYQKLADLGGGRVIYERIPSSSPIV